jgi:hypothetical protein
MICTLERDSPRIREIEIPEWIHEKMEIPRQVVLMIQIDGTKRQVYTNVRTREVIENIIARAKGTQT